MSAFSSDKNVSSLDSSRPRALVSLVRENPLKKERGAIYKELIITNYDPRPLMDQQLDLFEREMDEKWVLVPVNIPTHTLKTL